MKWRSETVQGHGRMGGAVESEGDEVRLTVADSLGRTVWRGGRYHAEKLAHCLNEAASRIAYSDGDLERIYEDACDQPANLDGIAAVLKAFGVER